MLSQVGATQAPYDHEMVRVVPRVSNRHVLKYPVVGSKCVVHPGPHYPPLTHHHPLPQILEPRPLLREQVPHNIFYPRCRYLQRIIIFLYLCACNLQINIEFPRDNQLCPPWSLCHCRLHIPNCHPVSRCQVTSNNLSPPPPQPLSSLFLLQTSLSYIPLSSLLCPSSH